uniref:Cation-transporting P-type ATPase C-terminal domain-containing protein n=1 Tax=Tetranychus urticae TaxID=32264 RepID=T1K1A4_TETUR
MPAIMLISWNESNLTILTLGVIVLAVEEFFMSLIKRKYWSMVIQWVLVEEITK